jgi:hypothetical protein
VVIGTDCTGRCKSTALIAHLVLNPTTITSTTMMATEIYISNHCFIMLTYAFIKELVCCGRLKKIMPCIKPDVRAYWDHIQSQSENEAGSSGNFAYFISKTSCSFFAIITTSLSGGLYL